MSHLPKDLRQHRIRGMTEILVDWDRILTVLHADSLDSSSVAR